MVAVVTCPACGSQGQVPEALRGQPTRCPNCLTLIPAQPAQPSLLNRPVAAPPPAPVGTNRTMLGQAEAMIRYFCPTCKKPLESPASLAGQKLHCQHCQQRLQVPQAAAAAPVDDRNRTKLASTEEAAPPPPPPRPEPVVEVVPTRRPAEAPAGRSENCLECGMDVSQRTRVQSCPDCGALLCSALCSREHHHHAHSRRERRPPPRDDYPPAPVAGPSAGVAVMLELLPGLLMQTFGIGHMYAGNVPQGLLIMFGYWFVLFVNCLLLVIGIGFLTLPLCWLVTMILSSIIAAQSCPNP